MCSYRVLRTVSFITGGFGDTEISNIEEEDDSAYFE